MRILPVAVLHKHVLLIGAGKIAAQKAKVISDSDCKLTIIAREINDAAFDTQSVTLKSFEESDLVSADFDIVVNATGDKNLSKWLWENRKKYHYWLNCVDMPEFCDFYFEATYRNHDLCVSVSTGGASPSYAQHIRDLLRTCVPEQPPEFYQSLPAQRTNTLTYLLPDKNVYLIGCGTGDVNHLTLEAIKILSTLQVALVDALVGQSVIDLLPKDCLIISVSKQKSSHSVSQDDINLLMLKYARQNLRVGRLKGGDPLIFGRLFEEASFLLSHQLEPILINGISSFLSGSLVAGIPPTLRGISTGVLVTSAHLSGCRFNNGWLEIVRERKYTVIVLMAYSFALEIQQSAMDKNIPLDIPAAFVSKIDSPEQTTVFGNLGVLNDMAELCSKPAILIVGDAVASAESMPYLGKRFFL